MAKYSNTEDLRRILSNFLKEKFGANIKFNIVLSKEIENYLDWASFYYKKNKSEFIRDIILEHMKNDDPNYQKYVFGESALIITYPIRPQR